MLDLEGIDMENWFVTQMLFLRCLYYKRNFFIYMSKDTNKANLLFPLMLFCICPLDVCWLMSVWIEWPEHFSTWEVYKRNLQNKIWSLTDLELFMGREDGDFLLFVLACYSNISSIFLAGYEEEKYYSNLLNWTHYYFFFLISLFKILTILIPISYLISYWGSADPPLPPPSFCASWFYFCCNVIVSELRQSTYFLCIIQQINTIMLKHSQISVFLVHRFWFREGKGYFGWTRAKDSW